MNTEFNIKAGLKSPFNTGRLSQRFGDLSLQSNKNTIVDPDKYDEAIEAVFKDPEYYGLTPELLEKNQKLFTDYVTGHSYILDLMAYLLTLDEFVKYTHRQAEDGRANGTDFSSCNIPIELVVRAAVGPYTQYRGDFIKQLRKVSREGNIYKLPVELDNHPGAYMLSKPINVRFLYEDDKRVANLKRGATSGSTKQKIIGINLSIYLPMLYSIVDPRDGRPKAFLQLPFYLTCLSKEAAKQYTTTRQQVPLYAITIQKSVIYIAKHVSSSIRNKPCSVDTYKFLKACMPGMLNANGFMRNNRECIGMISRILNTTIDLLSPSREWIKGRVALYMHEEVAKAFNEEVGSFLLTTQANLEEASSKMENGRIVLQTY